MRAAGRKTRKHCPSHTEPLGSFQMALNALSQHLWRENEHAPRAIMHVALQQLARAPAQSVKRCQRPASARWVGTSGQRFEASAL